MMAAVDNQLNDTRDRQPSDISASRIALAPDSHAHQTSLQGASFPHVVFKVLAIPFVALALAQYLRVGYKANSVLQHPETLPGQETDAGCISGLRGLRLTTVYRHSMAVALLRSNRNATPVEAPLADFAQESFAVLP
jgi:hypothetical protein